MPIRFRCTSCNTLLSIAKRKAGRAVDCPKCKQKLTVPKPGERPETSTFEDDEFEDYLIGDGGPLSVDPDDEGNAPPEPKPPPGELVGTGRRTRSARAKRLADRAKRRPRGPGPARESSRKAKIDLDVLEEGLADAELPDGVPDTGVEKAEGKGPPPGKDAPAEEAPSDEDELHDSDVLDDVEIVEEPPEARPVKPPPGSEASSERSSVAPTRVEPLPARPVKPVAPPRAEPAGRKPLAVPAAVPPDPTPIDTPAIEALLRANTRRTGLKVAKLIGVLVLMLLMFAAGFLVRHLELVPVGGGAGSSAQPDAPGGGIPRIRGQISVRVPGADQAQPDVGARLILLPQESQPPKDNKIGWEGLSTEPVPRAPGEQAGPSLAGAVAVEALGGYVATADVEGTYVLCDLKPGHYHLLAVSANAKRAPDQAINENSFDLLSRYFQGVKLVLGFRQFELRSVQVRENEDISFDHRFGVPAPAKAAAPGK